jgi:hypothetical protein
VQRHDEEKKVVVLTAEDFKNTHDFFDHFKMEMPKQLKDLLSTMEKDPKTVTFEQQKMFRALVAHAMVSVNHPLVKDKAFENIRTKCDKAWYDAQFDMDVEEIFARDKKEEAVTQASSKAE